jgi:hypothetical protein
MIPHEIRYLRAPPGSRPSPGMPIWSVVLTLALSPLGVACSPSSYMRDGVSIGVGGAFASASGGAGLEPGGAGGSGVDDLGEGGAIAIATGGQDVGGAPTVGGVAGIGGQSGDAGLGGPGLAVASGGSTGAAGTVASSGGASSVASSGGAGTVASSGGAGGARSGSGGGLGPGGGDVGGGLAGAGGHASGTVDSAQYNFETSTQGWIMSTGVGAGAFTSISRSTTTRWAGMASLAGTLVSQGGETYQLLVTPPAIAPGTVVTFHVLFPVGAAIEWVQPYIQEGPESLPTAYRWTTGFTLGTDLVYGDWNTIPVQLPIPATVVTSLGVQFKSLSAWSGTVYVDSVGW